MGQAIGSPAGDRYRQAMGRPRDPLQAGLGAIVRGKGWMLPAGYGIP